VFYGKTESAVRESPEGGWFGWFGSEGEAMEQVAADAFIPVPPNAAIPQPIKKQIFANVMTVGGYQDAGIKTKLTVIHDPSWMVHQINCQIIGSQVVASAWKVRLLCIAMQNACECIYFATLRSRSMVIQI
jgi:hypothetical protein